MLAVKNYNSGSAPARRTCTGDECLANVAAHSKEIVARLNESGKASF